MKKKSLLILPVLLLALAACNKEEEVEEPEDDVPTVTEPTEPSDTSEDEKEDEKEDLPPVVIDERIKVAEGVATLEDSNVEPSTASYLNQSVLSLEADWDDDDNVVYTVSGTASVMSAEQANVYWNSVAQEGDAFIVLTLKLDPGETVTWQAPDKVKTIEYAKMERTGEEDLILRISGTSSYGDGYSTTYSTVEGQVTFVVTDADGEEVNHIVDFSNVAIVDSRIVVTPGEVDSEAWTNEHITCFESVTKDATSGNITYVLDGELSKMTPCQASAFGAGATENDEYVLLTVFLQSGETVTWGTEISEEKTRCYNQYPNGMDVVLKVTSEGASSVKFTIADCTNSTTVDHIIDLSAYVTTSEGA